MDENQLREIASQLSCPSGDTANTIGAKMNDTNAFITERSIERLSPKAGDRIIEIGPGNGQLSIPIVEALGPSGHYTGLELSEEMAVQARKTLALHDAAQITIQAGDCLVAPVERRTIDGLMAVNVLYFIDDLSAFLNTVSQWLKPGGRAVFGVRSAQSLEGMPFTQYGFRIRSLEEITEQLKENGFADVDSRYFDEGLGMLGDLEIPVDSLIIKAVAA